MSFPEITAAEAYERRDRYRFIDVRQIHEFDGPLGHAEGAELVPLPTVSENLSKLSGPRPLLLICRSGKRSAAACDVLQEVGIQKVTNLADGMIGWNLAGLPVSRTDPKTLCDLVEQIVCWTAQVGPLTRDCADDIARHRFERQHVEFDAPSHAAVEDLIHFVAESLQPVNPPDLELSLAAFRRSLAVL